MISNFLITKFIKNHQNTTDKKVRDSYGYLGGIVGMIANIILFVVKLFIGIFSNSIAIVADAINNLSDTASSLVTILGFKLASKPADSEHPFGHGRIEYLSGLIVSFMVMLVGFEFIRSSYERIVNPQIVKFEIIPFILILLSILMKIWLSKFNNYIGKKINSSALQASSYDALGDVFTSSTVAVSFLISQYVSFPIDGYIGIAVSLFIMYSGFNLIKDTINPLLGEKPDPELVKNILEGIMSYDYISGVHDLVVHNYGPGRIIASIHAEVPCNISILKIHEVIDKAEKELSKKLDIDLVIHMDPINTDDEEVSEALEDVLKIIKKYPMINSIHDFRIIGHGDIKNLLFDIVIDYKQRLSPKFKQDLTDNINGDLKLIHDKYTAIITIDRDLASS